MPSLLTVGISQSHTLATTHDTLLHLKQQTKLAAQKDISILLFPEAFLGGYPRTCNFGASIGARAPEGRDQYLSYHRGAVDLGDTFGGAGDEWVNKRLPQNPKTGYRGDGTREFLEQVSRETGVFLVVGLVEKAGGSLFCSAVYVHPIEGMIAKRRKVQPTGTERLVWAQGSPATLKAVSTVIKGVRLVIGTAICWENFMPLLRYALYAQGVNLWLAPTADARPTWEGLLTTIASEGRCFVLSGNMCQKYEDLPEWASGRNEVAGKDVVNGVGENTSKSSTATSEVYASRGGSCIVGPLGNIIKAPVWEKQGELVYAEVDFEECERGKFDFDATGHYSRHDAFKLTVEGLDLLPPP